MSTATPLPFSLREGRAPRRLQRIARPLSPMTRIPNMSAERRTLVRMSPLRMWLNSWPMTPCSSSRESFCRAPRVTVTTASFEVRPAANALIAFSSSRM